VLNTNPYTRELGAQGLTMGAIIQQTLREADEAKPKRGAISNLQRN